MLFIKVYLQNILKCTVFSQCLNEIEEIRIVTSGI